MRIPPDILPLLAQVMRSPIRCGGLDYIDGKPMYRHGGKLYTPEEFQALEDSMQSSPLEPAEAAKLRDWLSKNPTWSVASTTMSEEIEVTTTKPAKKIAKKTAAKAAAKKAAKAVKAPAAKKVAKAAVKAGPSKEETKTGVHTFPDPEGGWANKRNGRLASKHPSKGEAVKAGRELAMKAKLEHTIHNANGKISAKNSYGVDPVSKKG